MPALSHRHLADLDLAVATAGPTEDVGGQGRVVLLHGLGQDHRMWAEVQADLPELRTEALDLRGHGSTSLGSAVGTLAQLADDAAAYLSATGPAVVAGFSLGGSIALRTAAERPDLVTGVIAIATSSIVGRSAAEAMATRISDVESGGLQILHRILATDTLSQLAGQPQAVAEIIRQREDAVGTGAGYLNGARAVISMREDSLHDRLRLITCPVLIVSGEHDAWCPRRAAELMLEQLPHAQFVEVSGVGHLISDENPQALVDIIGPWMQRNGLS